MNRHFLGLSRWWVNLPKRVMFIGVIIFCLIMGFMVLHSYRYVAQCNDSLIGNLLITIAYSIILFTPFTFSLTVAMKEYIELDRVHEELKKTSVLDELTGLYHRSYLLKAQYLTVLNAVKNNCTLTVIIVDIDDLKFINDNYGHSAGDIAIKSVAKKISELFSGGANCAIRYGGDEIIILVNSTEPKIIEDKIGELNRAIKIKVINNSSKHADEAILEVSTSCGYSHRTFSEELTQEMISEEFAEKMHKGLFLSADAKMYEVKTLKKKAKLSNL